MQPLASQEQFEQAQAWLVSNRRFARRNNKAHPYLLENLVSCDLSCLARSTHPPAPLLLLHRQAAGLLTPAAEAPVAAQPS